MVKLPTDLSGREVRRALERPKRKLPEITSPKRKLPEITSPKRKLPEITSPKRKRGGRACTENDSLAGASG